MKNGMFYSVGMAVGAMSLSALAGGLVTETVDLSGVDMPVGWTVANGSYHSPEYSNAVSRIELSYMRTTNGQSGEAQVFAIDHASGASAQIAAVNTATMRAAFDFPEESDYRRFQIATNGLSVGRFSATWYDPYLAAPVNVSAAALTADSLAVSWDPVDGAVAYKVSVWTNKIEGASAGTEHWVDDFANAAAGGINASAIDSALFNSSYADTQYWECNPYIYPSTNSSAIRIGGADKSKAGVLTSPQLAAGDWHVRMRAWRYRSEDGTDMPIMRVSAGVTSRVAVVVFTQEPAIPEEFMIALPALDAGDRLQFCSFTNKTPRVILDRVALVSGYAAGTSTPDVVREVQVSDGTSCTIGNLPAAVPVRVGVTAIGAHGMSAMSESVAVDLAQPPQAGLNACPLSSLTGNVYSQDFDSLAEISATTGDKTWLNGTTLPYWQAWQDGDAIEKFAYNGGAAAIAGLYALASNRADSVRALGARTKLGSTMAWGMAFTNDTGVAMTLTRVSYSAQQWGFANTNDHTLVFSCLVTNRLDWIVNYGDGWNDCAETSAQVLGLEDPHATPEVTAVEYLPIGDAVRVMPGEILTLRWRLLPPAKGSSALMAIDDLAVAFEAAARPTLIRIVHAARRP